MAKNCLFLAAFLLLAVPALGQQDPSNEDSIAPDVQSESSSSDELRTQAPAQEAERDYSYQARGFSVMVGRELGVRGFAETDFGKQKANLDQRGALSVGLGYNAIRTRKIGGTIGLVYSSYEVSEGDGTAEFDSVRALANLTYGFDGGFYLYGGGNLAYIYNDVLNEELDASPSVGLQAGVGYQITPNFAFTLGGLIQQTTYSGLFEDEDVNRFSLEDRDLTLRIQGINTGITATF